MIGDQANILGRLKSALPSRWFTGATPILDALLNGSAAIFAQVYLLYAYAVLQSRIKTSTEAWLDLVSGDYFGTGLPRLTGESDTTFRTRILANLFVHRTTRPAMASILTALTGHAPKIFEPMNPNDTGALRSVSPLGYCGVARCGSLGTPFNIFITVYRDATTTTPSLGAAFIRAPQWSAMAAPLSHGYTGSLSGGVSLISNAAIYAAIMATKPAGSIVWVAIKNWTDQTPLTLVDYNANTVQASVGGSLQQVVVLPPSN